MCVLVVQVHELYFCALCFVIETGVDIIYCKIRLPGTLPRPSVRPSAPVIALGSSPAEGDLFINHAERWIDGGRIASTAAPLMNYQLDYDA